MAATYSMHNFYRPSSLTVDTHAPQTYFEEDEGSILDENILDQSALDSGLEMSPPMAGSRRDSFAVSSSLFSPKTDEWQHVDMQHQQHQPMSSNNPFVEHSNNPFMRIDAQSGYGQPNHGWAMNNNSGMSTPMHGHDGIPAEFEVNQPIFQRPMQTPFSNSGVQPLPLFSSGNTSNGSIPTSPQKEWSIADNMDNRMPKRMRPHSPTLRSHPEMSRRGDGIRKKNARFDIPAERNLTNIDQLIAQSTDEQEIKELKQQKRLLRNRQAALDSRQRKKQHTERLEDEKKHYTGLINDLEEELAEAKLALDDFARKEQQYQQYIENMHMEKEEMVSNHTIETGELRKKVSVLTEHVQRLESNAMSTVPSSNGFSTDYADIDSLAMDGAWDNISFLNDFSSEGDVKVENNALVPLKKTENTLLSEPEKPAAQGLLLMLLLVGAFVASKGSSPAIPQLSDDVRAASTTLLEDIFNDAGVSQTSTGVSAMAPMTSTAANTWSTSMSSMGGTEMLGVTPSALGDLADSLSQPTEEQNNEQIFSLSAAQYNGLNSHDFLQNTPQPSTSQGRRNLGETLAAMRSNSKKSAAEVYTRSLLWDQVPSEVVRNFAKMVSLSDQHEEGHTTPVG
ncbi:hypothetical protein HYALB_00004195 [Hymenoscyphus albidus]|uniref:BZIP domain-containing protein n=1 Tax=Hymenoscyphus albidus TaxID=595503 RepID=A0A9N9QE58_9HELO|nr:hypothetical protein HYALB_00004195 [Hymenoscyphus albidus]